ncbi:hypothetical protein ACHAXR_005932 [Thalassiosira sp. AJA248-18]
MNFTTPNEGSLKRRKTVDPNTIASINHLSNDNLATIASFLPKTSRALLAVALTAPALSWRKNRWKGEPNAASKTIISSVKISAPFSTLIRDICREDELGDRCRLRRNVGMSKYNEAFEASLKQQLQEYYEVQWEILDFVDIGRTLASRLTDDDIGAILVCIDAKNNLKRLKLGHCFNLVGHGLTPLHCSTVLEKIDMGLARQFEAPELFEGAKISQDAVFDVLASILGVRTNAFRRLQMPMQWWTLSSNDVIPGEGLRQHLKGYNHILNKRSSCCYFGFACSEKEFLEQMMRGPNQQDLIDTCVDCASCQCFEVCGDCGTILCSECEYNYIYSCESCSVSSCLACIECSENTVAFCNTGDCGYACCDKCRLNECRQGVNNCDGCRSLAFIKLLEENEQLRNDLEWLQL